MNSHERQQLALSRMRRGPIRHELLTDDLLEVIGRVHRSIGRYLGISLEQFEIGFMRAESPETEVAVWNTIAAAWDNFHQNHIGRIQLPYSDEQALVAALVGISMGVQRPDLLGITAAVGNRLLACFDEALGP